MSYAYPDFDAADATFEGADAYTLPAFDEVDFDWVPPDQVFAYAAVNSPLYTSVEATGDVPTAGVISLPQVFGTVYGEVRVAPAGYVSVASPLIAYATAFHDFTVAIPDSAIDRYYALVYDENEAATRVPISSWQATLQVGSQSYAQFVVPAVEDWIDQLRAAVRFEVVRGVELPDGTSLSIVMAEAPFDTMSLARGGFRYTATVSGYGDAFETNEDIDAIYDRTLVGQRTRFESTNSMRIRCSIDWLLRPGQRAIVDNETTMTVAYINYYVQARGDSYMDVGSRAENG